MKGAEEQHTTRAKIAREWKYYIVTYPLGDEAGSVVETPVLAPNEETALLGVPNYADEELGVKTIGGLDAALGQLTCSKTPKREEIVAFFGYLQRCMDAGFATQEALKTSLVVVRSPVFRGMIGRMRNIITTGDGNLDAGLAEFPDVFDSSYVEMIRAAQLSGGLADMIKAIASALANANRIRKKLIQKMTYPALVFALGAVASCVLLFVSLPGTVKQALDAGEEVWAISLYPYYAVTFCLANPVVFALPAALIATLACFRKAMLKSVFMQRCLNAIPKLGPTMLAVSLVNPLRVLAMTQRAKMPPTTRMELALKSTESLVVRDFFHAVGARIEVGRSLSESRAGERWRLGAVGNDLAAQATISAKTGKGIELLENLAGQIEESTEEKINALSLVIEPIAIFSTLIMVFFAFASVYSVQVKMLFDALQKQ
jgi:type II secretory pathway component PulF